MDEKECQKTWGSTWPTRACIMANVHCRYRYDDPKGIRQILFHVCTLKNQKQKQKKNGFWTDTISTVFPGVFFFNTFVVKIISCTGFFFFWQSLVITFLCFYYYSSFWIIGEFEMGLRIRFASVGKIDFCTFFFNLFF